MLIPRFREPKLPKYDLKAGRQIFDKEHTREDKRCVFVDPEAENPIDIKLRQLALASLDGQIDLKIAFIDKWVAGIVGEINNICIMTGRIKDLYLPTRDIRFRTRQGVEVITSFDKIIQLSDRELS